MDYIKTILTFEITDCQSSSIVSNLYILLASIMYAVSLTKLSRYSLFETHRVFSCDFSRSSFLRLLIGLATNLAGLLLLILGYNVFLRQSYSFGNLFAAGLWSFSFLSFNRIIHAIIATNFKRCFFDQFYLKKLHGEYPINGEETFLSHFIPGILYLAIPVIFSLLIASNN